MFLCDSVDHESMKEVVRPVDEEAENPSCNKRLNVDPEVFQAVFRIFLLYFSNY